MNGNRPAPISYSELHAYSQMMGVRLSPWEVEAIRALDDEFLAAAHKDASDG